MPRPQDSNTTTSPAHAMLTGIRAVCCRTSSAAMPVRPARNSGLPNHPYPRSNRLKESYSRGTDWGAPCDVRYCVTHLLMSVTPVKHHILTDMDEHQSVA